MAKYNLALLPINENHNKTLCDISQSFAKNIYSTYILGVNSYPHVTIGQFVAEQNQLENVWQNVKDIKIDFNISVSSYYCSESSKEGFYSGIEVLKTDELTKLQEKVINALTPIEITSEKGINFFPHFTIGYSQNSAAEIIKSLTKDEALFNQQIAVYLAIGKSGKNGKFEEIIFK